MLEVATTAMPRKQHSQGWNKRSRGWNKLLLSPDIAVYHISVTVANLTANQVVVQLNTVGCELKLVHLNRLVSTVEDDLDLYKLPNDTHNAIPQVLYIATGCNFTPLVLGIYKVTFLKVFYNYTGFITVLISTTPGSLADISQETNDFLAIMGLSYMTKKSENTPHGFLHPSYNNHRGSLDHHKTWYEHIRAKTCE